MNQPRLRILMICNRYYPIVGGAEYQGRLLARSLTQRGHEVHIVTRRIVRKHPPADIIDGVSVRRLSPVGLSKWANATMFWRLMWYLLWHGKQYDVIHVQGIGPLGLAAIVGARLRQKPIALRVSTQGDLARTVGSATTLYSRIVRRVLVPPVLWNWLLRRATAFVVLSTAMQAEAASVGLQNKTFRIPNCVDTTRFTPSHDLHHKTMIRQALGLAETTPVIVSTGRLVCTKRIDVVLQAFAQVVVNHPNSVLAVLGGSQYQMDDVTQPLKDLSKQLHVESQVRMLGNVENVSDYLRAADVFVFASEREGMPNAILEAMASRVPIVTTHVAGIRDLLDESCAWLVPVAQSQPIAQAIHTIIALPDLAEQRAQVAYTRATADEYAIQTMVDAYEALYHRLRA